MSKEQLDKTEQPEFFDSKGQHWRIVFNTKDLLDGMRALDFRMQDLQPDSDRPVAIETLIALAWYGVRHFAKSLEAPVVNEEQFWARIPPAQMYDVGVAVMVALTIAFPSPGEAQGKGANASPLPAAVDDKPGSDKI